MKIRVTKREAQILELVDGEAELPQKAIAAHLGISQSTVKAHLKSARKKFGTRSSGRAARLWFLQEYEAAKRSSATGQDADRAKRA